MASGYFMSNLGPYLNFGLCVDHSVRNSGMKSLPTNRIDCENLTWTWQSPPFFPPNNPITMWTIGNAWPFFAFQFFNSGWAFFVYSVCYLLWDIPLVSGRKLKPIPFFTTFGTNSLITYLLHGLVMNNIKNMIPRDSPALFVILVGLPIVLFCVWVPLKFLQNRKIFIAL